MTIGLKGLYTPDAPEDRDIAYLEVNYNDQIYDWQLYVPRGVDLGQYLNAKESSIYADIDAKEAVWAALEPKTRIRMNPMGMTEQEVPIPKTEIVRPDAPDYYALRRREYPSIGDQLGALWKGTDSDEFAEMQARIQAVKDKYPKA